MEEEQDLTSSTPATNSQAEPLVEENTGVVIISPDEDYPQSKWYVLHTYSGHEQKVGITLKERVELSGLTHKVFKIFIPTHKKIIISEGKKKSVNEMLFPGYVIVKMILGDDTWHVVRATRGVTGFVGTGTTPTPISETEVKALMRYTKMDAPKFEAKFSTGDSVKITDGPFSESIGKVEEVNEAQGKVKVLVSIFGRETPVELDFLQVTNI